MDGNGDFQPFPIRKDLVNHPIETTILKWMAISFQEQTTGSFSSTALKFNMEPENQPLEKEIPFGNHHFQVPAVKLWGCKQPFSSMFFSPKKK